MRDEGGEEGLQLFGDLYRVDMLHGALRIINVTSVSKAEKRMRTTLPVGGGKAALYRLTTRWPKRTDGARRGDVKEDVEVKSGSLMPTACPIWVSV